MKSTAASSIRKLDNPNAIYLADALRVDALPDDLREWAADLLRVVTWAAEGCDVAVKQLRKVAQSRPIRSKDPHQRSRAWIVRTLTQLRNTPSHPAYAKDGRKLASADSPVLIREILGRLNEQFRSLDPAFIKNAQRERAIPRLAARLSVECGAFGDSDSGGPSANMKLRKEDAIARATALFAASTNESSRAKPHKRPRVARSPGL